MQTMEQALADLTVRHVVNINEALSRSSRPEQLMGILERSGFDVSAALASTQPEAPQTPQPQPALRMAGS